MTNSLDTAPRTGDLADDLGDNLAKLETLSALIVSSMEHEDGIMGPHYATGLAGLLRNIHADLEATHGHALEAIRWHEDDRRLNVEGRANPEPSTHGVVIKPMRLFNDENGKPLRRALTPAEIELRRKDREGRAASAATKAAPASA